MDEMKKNLIVSVDDDHDSRALLSQLLADEGYEILEFDNAREAQDAILAMRNGIVLADWMMPGTDGLALLRFIREMESMQALGSVYFIMLTGAKSREELIQALDAGADDYMTKPYDQQELMARIRAGERILNLQQQVWERQTDLAKANLELTAARRRLEQMANTDALTGLLNRRALFDRFRDCCSIAERHSRALSCIMLDVDKFKSVNDTYGHHAGDCVLKAVAMALRGSLRRHDICGRFGGEEFCIVCPETPLDGAGLVAERLRQALENETIDADGQILRVTASFGVATQQPGDRRPEEMVNRADAMLYRAKQSGRNQVWMIDPQGLATRYAEAVAPA